MSERTPVRLVIVLGSVNAIGPLSIDMYLPAFPEIANALSTSATQVQLTLTACVAGLALGQLLIGPLSDRLGRRLPLIAAMVTYAAASVLCAIAPSVPVLIGLRFVQGLAGAGGVVIARAVVRDLHSGAAAVRLFSSLMLVTGLAPILAPLLGGQILNVTSWRGIFLVLAVLSALIAVLAAVGLRETLPPERRSDHGLARTLQTMRALLRDRWFVGHGLAGGLAFGALFAYISGSSFVLQGIYGVSPQLYSVLFAMNGLGLIAGSQINARLVGRYGPSALLRAGLLAIAASASALLVVVLAGGLGVGAVLAPMFVIVSSLAFVLPNSTALALADHPEVAGTASALLGTGQFVIGATVAPIVGAGGTDSAVPMAAIMTVVALAALGVRHVAANAPPEDHGMTLVTIAASYGAGGSRVAPQLARRLDVPFLDRPDLPADEGEGTGEKPLLSRLASMAVSWGTPAGLSTEELLPDDAARREFEREVRAIGAQGRGVILGRGAAAVLRDHPKALHVLLDAPADARVRQAMVIEGIDQRTAERRLTHQDRYRRAYLEGFYGVDVRAPGVFHVVLDSTALALEDCVELIADAARRR